MPGFPELVPTTPEDEWTEQEWVDYGNYDRAHKLIYGGICATGRSGEVQKLLVKGGLVLLEVRQDATIEGDVDAVVFGKIATNNHALLKEWFVTPRGSGFNHRAKAIAADMQEILFAAVPEYREEAEVTLGGYVDAALQTVVSVSRPTLAPAIAAMQQKLLPNGRGDAWAAIRQASESEDDDVVSPESGPRRMRRPSPTTEG
jgi:hypothetical protein